MLLLIIRAHMTRCLNPMKFWQTILTILICRLQEMPTNRKYSVIWLQKILPNISYRLPLKLYQKIKRKGAAGLLFLRHHLL